MGHVKKRDSLKKGVIRLVLYLGDRGLGGQSVARKDLTIEETLD